MHHLIGADRASRLALRAEAGVKDSNCYPAESVV